MVSFDNDYWNSMDNYFIKTKEPLSAKELGISVGVGDPLEMLKANINVGAQAIELGFMGQGKGSNSQVTGYTPETIGKTKREAIKELSKINKVQLSTHASANAAGFAGLGERGFSDEAAERNMIEVRRAVDFAADTAGGGAVVIHTAEFPVTIAEKYPQFEKYPGEAKKGMIGVVDEKTGELLQLNREVELDVVEKDKNNRPIISRDESGELDFKWKKLNFGKYSDEGIKEGKFKDVEAAGKAFYREYMEKQLLQARSERERWFSHAKKSRDQLEFVENLYENAKKNIKKDKTEAEILTRQTMQKFGLEPSKMSDEYDDYLKDPIQQLGKQVMDIKRDVRYNEEASISQGKQEKEIFEKMKRLKTMSEFALDKSTSNIAKLGIYAYTKEKAQKLDRPLYIAPENVFPENGYGSHPQELKNLIQKSREAMTNQLIEKKMVSDKKEAEKIAKEHIKATFDVAHANTWRKYFKGSDKDFDKWLKGQIDDLTKEGIIGHGHLSDNFGYYDEHLTLGEGNAPIGHFIDAMKKAGVNEPFIVEGGAQDQGRYHEAMTHAWSRLGASMTYRVGAIASRSWTDVPMSTFGPMYSTPHAVGPYVTGGAGLTPISKEWGAYSETPLE